jgi:alpha-tubulin suppressor-like RCC1 family protein
MTSNRITYNSAVRNKVGGVDLLCSIAVAALVLLTLPSFESGVSAQADTRTVVFGTRHAVALKNNGDVLTWGDNVGCQLGRAGGNRSTTPGQVLRNIKEIAAASAHTLALDVDGKVYAWGSDAPALGNADEHERCEGPEPVATLADKTIAHIATGINFSLAVTTAGDLLCTGENDMGQCPVGRGGTSSFTPVPYPELAGKVAAVRAGAYHALVLTKDGQLFAFGRAREGQLGNGKTTSVFGPVPELTEVVSFAAGTWHSAAVRADGSAWVWGSNGRSELCDGTTVNKPSPMRVPLPGNQKATHVAAGGSSTLVRTGDGSLFGCGDNQFSSLGVDAPRVVPRPTMIASGVAAAGIAVAGGSYAAYSTDGCAVRMGGSNHEGLVNGTDQSSQVSFTLRQGVSLCGVKPDKPLPTRLFIPPSGGASGCWTPRVQEDGFASAKYAALRDAVLAAENIVKASKAFLDAPVPVRFRSAASVGHYDNSGAGIHIKAAPERTSNRTRLWTGECGVIPQIDRIGGAVAQISIFFNRAGEQFVSQTGEGPKLTGKAGGYPEYNNWVVITKDGRLPWIPQTLADKLDAEGKRRRDKLAEYLKTRSQMKVMDEAAALKTYEALKKTDPAGADKFMATIAEQREEVKRLQEQVYPANIAQLEKEVKDYEQYRASFTAEQLRAPAVWSDTSGAGRKKLDADIAALQQLPPAVQAEIDALPRDNERASRVRTIRQRYIESVSNRMADLRAQYDLTSLKPGTASDAMSFKRDPSFPDYTNPSRVQVITVTFQMDTQPDRRAWQTRVKETLDYAALAALIK